MTTPTQPQEEKRSARYPVIVEHALSLYMLENYDGVARSKQIADTLKKKASDLLALDPQVSTIRLVIANQTDPEGTLQTYNYAYIGVFFHNVTRAELEGYAAKLNAEFEKDRTYLFTHPDGLELPAPEAYVPDREWIETQIAELSDISERSKAFFNEDGSVNEDAVNKATQEMLDDAKSKKNDGERITAQSSSSQAGDTSPADGVDAEDIDEMDLI